MKLSTLLCLLACAVVCLFALSRLKREPYDWQRQNEAAEIAANQAAAERDRAILRQWPEFQRLIAELYGVDRSQILQTNILKLTFHPGHDTRANRDAISKVWAHRTGQGTVITVP